MLFRQAKRMKGITQEKVPNINTQICIKIRNGMSPLNVII